MDCYSNIQGKFLGQTDIRLSLLDLGTLQLELETL